MSDTNTSSVKVEGEDTGTPVVTFNDKGDARLGRDPDSDDDDVGSAGGGEGEGRSRAAMRRQRQKENQRRAREGSAHQIEALSSVVAAQDHMIKMIARGQQEHTLTALDTEMRNAQLAYQEAQRREAEAISRGDGPTASEARTVMQNANRYFSVAKGNTDQIRSNMVQVPPRPDPNARPATRSAEGDRYMSDFLKEQSWIDLSKNDATAAAVKAIDASVMADGFKADSKEYWDEFRDRLQEELPHKFVQQRKQGVQSFESDDEDGRPRRGGPPLGGAGRDGGGSAPRQIRLTPAMVKGLDDAGIPLTGGSPEMAKRRNRILADWRSS